MHERYVSCYGGEILYFPLIEDLKFQIRNRGIIQAAVDIMKSSHPRRRESIGVTERSKNCVAPLEGCAPCVTWASTYPDGKLRMLHPLELSQTFARVRQPVVQSSIPRSAVAHPAGESSNCI